MVGGLSHLLVCTGKPKSKESPEKSRIFFLDTQGRNIVIKQ